MPELIDREHLVNILLGKQKYTGDPSYFEALQFAIEKARELPDEQPTIEPEVRRGEWIIKRDEFYTAYEMYYAECSKCKHTESVGMADRLKFCPNCGAEMREEAKQE